jgi:hypothetical protein
MPGLSSVAFRNIVRTIAILAASIPVSAQTFTMNESFLRTMSTGNTIQPTFSVRITANGPLHTLANDCEMHVAGRVQDASLGTPPAIVVEFPNWCKFNPQGALGDSFNSLRTTWANFVTANLINKTCDVKGFLRIFCEHCQGGGSGGSNPNHAYEFHPALSMRCGTEDFAFDSMLRTFPGLRHISPSTANNCIRGRRLQVRFKNNRYEFLESGGGSCGNFAIVTVNDFDFDWSGAIDGGHYTFATVTADGQHTGNIGLYTLTGSEIDMWLRDAIAAGGMGNTRKTIHGVFTYDWESIYLALVDDQGNLRKPTQWTEVEFPLALIAYGETTAPF